jgi:hypothetical protein
MNTLEYLRSGKTLDDLHAELAIEVNRHDTLPLVILNYSQIDSPKTHPIVRECRGLVLNTENWSLVARAFPRFFNWGEVADEMPLFNWNNSTALEKVDGSLCLFYHFDGEWRVNTRGSFAGMPLFNTQWQADYHKMPMSFTWREGILRALGIKDLSELNAYLDPALSYACEFCSLWNKVVREYPEPCIYQLSAFCGEEEVGPQQVPFFRDVKNFSLRTADEVTDYVNNQPEATWEGCVVKDDANRRWKIKNKRYLAYHKAKGNNGANLYNPSTLLPIILSNEGDEWLTAFPEVTDCFNCYKAKVDNAFCELEALWARTQAIENQKEFALSIVGKTPFTSILFNTRKAKANLKDEWRKSEDIIVKTLFK